jgi:tRNA 2-thiouridine synthesizing protein A
LLKRNLVIIMEFDVELDTSGLSCPMPIMKLGKQIKSMQSGQVVKLIGTDPGSLDDVPKWCKRTKNELLHTESKGGNYFFYIKKG